MFNKTSHDGPGESIPQMWSNRVKQGRATIERHRSINARDKALTMHYLSVLADYCVNCSGFVTELTELLVQHPERMISDDRDSFDARPNLGLIAALLTAEWLADNEINSEFRIVCSTAQRVLEEMLQDSDEDFWSISGLIKVVKFCAGQFL